MSRPTKGWCASPRRSARSAGARSRPASRSHCGSAPRVETQPRFPSRTSWKSAGRTTAIYPLPQGRTAVWARHWRRTEGQVALGTVLRRLPDLRLATETLEWQGNLALRGLKALPVAFMPRSA